MAVEPLQQSRRAFHTIHELILTMPRRVVRDIISASVASPFFRRQTRFISVLMSLQTIVEIDFLLLQHFSQHAPSDPFLPKRPPPCITFFNLFSSVDRVRRLASAQLGSHLLFCRLYFDACVFLFRRAFFFASRPLMKAREGNSCLVVLRHACPIRRRIFIVAATTRKAEK